MTGWNRVSCRISVACVLAALLVGSVAAADWPAAPSSWRGFQRYDFALDGLACRVVAPSEVAPGRPWVFRARFPDYHPEVDLILLRRGFHVAHIETGGMLGSPRARKHWEAFYRTLTEEHRLAPKPVIEAVSRGGLFAYAWATRHPDRVACIYADTPVCDIKSWPLGQGQGIGHQPTWQTLLGEYGMTHDQALAYQGNPIDTLRPLAKAKIPLMHIVSLNDRVVPPQENTFVLAGRYRQLGGSIDVIEAPEGTPQSSGHHFTLPDPIRAADFIELHAGPKSFVLRGSLDNSRIRFERDKVGRVVFLGGSITQNPGWRDLTCAYLQERFPETKFDFVNAGIASTGSAPGAFRLLRDVFGRGPVDLLFEEAAVNDECNGRSPTQMTRGMEGILHHARKVNPNLDIVVMHFVDPAKMADYRAGRTPEVIRQHEAVAERYAVASIHLAREVTRRIDAGQFTWENDFRNLHPSPLGQRLYAAAIRRTLAAGWSGPLPAKAAVAAHPMPGQPVDPFSYDAARLEPIAEASDLIGFTLIEKCDPRQPAGGGVRGGFVDVPMLVGAKSGDRFSLKFQGRAVGLFVAAGPDAGIIEHRIDDGPWRRLDLFTSWSQGLHLPWAYILEDELDGQQHTLTVRITAEHNANSRGHACRIVHLLVNQ